MPVVAGALGNKAILLACMPSFRFFQQYIAAKAKAIKTKTTPTKTPTKAEALPESKNTKVIGIHLLLLFGVTEDFELLSYYIIQFLVT